MRTVSYRIDGRDVTFKLDGETEVGTASVLLSEDDDLMQGRGWTDQGYTVERFLSDAECWQICDGMKAIIADHARQIGVATDVAFALEKYHHYVNTDALHAQLIGETRKGWDVAKFPVDVRLVEARISEILGVPVAALNPTFGQSLFHLRIVRPNRPHDNNPPHRDVWLDRLRNGMNIYFPIAGSNELSAMPLIPGSHRLAEEQIERSVHGARIEGLSYTVPAVTSTRGEFVMTRPNPRPHEVLVFSPYLIHGGAVNFNDDITRVSLEMRFFRKAAKPLPHNSSAPSHVAGPHFQHRDASMASGSHGQVGRFLMLEIFIRLYLG